VGVSNVDIVRQFFVAFDQRDADMMIAISRPDIVFQPVTADVAAAGQPYRGYDGLRTYLEDVARVWQELRPVPEVYYELEDGLIVATGRVYAWGAGRVVDAPAGWMFRVAGGKLAYGRTFGTASEALDAAGIDDPGALSAIPA
jgi:ketosteroid isomerase-like protein